MCDKIIMLPTVGDFHLRGVMITQKKVAEVNLESEMPTVDVAIQKMKNSLSTYKRLGYKAVILIHGYGSTGVGGGIKAAVVKCLEESSMKGIVKTFVVGEQWSSRKKELVGMCKALENYEHKIANNYGISVVILR
ncbi:MAG: hypothetical protein DDT30_01506 [Dehalococcoidia bacterium]|nr:hypothetical protein [Bacillota bacterium]MBT9143023.1 hypothetical protein [Bacillota bacterium]